MVAWRGHLSFKLYLPDKPDKFGVKLFILCDSSNGYSSRFEIYHGSDNNPSPKGKIYDLVMRLMNPYLNKGQYCSTTCVSWELVVVARCEQIGK